MFLKLLTLLFIPNEMPINQMLIISYNNQQFAPILEVNNTREKENRKIKTK